MNLQQLTVTSLTILGLTGAEFVLAQVPSTPQPDRNGDYFSNSAPIQAKEPFNSPGSLWQVVAPGLNCRSGAGIHSKIIRQFKQGEILQADIGRGGSDEVLVNAKDGDGKPWMRVRSSLGENYNCNIRANRHYIRPYTGKEAGSFRSIANGAN